MDTVAPWPVTIAHCHPPSECLPAVIYPGAAVWSVLTTGSTRHKASVLHLIQLVCVVHLHTQG